MNATTALNPVPVPESGRPMSIAITAIETAEQIRTRNGFDEESLRELASTIKAVGLIEPLVVRPKDGAPDAFVLIAGERRLLACSLAGLEHVPCLVRSVTAQRATLIQATENLQREQLCLSDVADAVAVLVREHGAKVTASMLGKSAAWVSKHHAITKLHADVRLVLDAGKTEDPELLNTLNAIRRQDKEVFMSLVDQIDTGDLTRSEARATLAAMKSAPGAKAPGAADLEDGDDDGEGGEDDGAGQGTSPKAAPWIRVALPKELADYFAQVGGQSWLIDRLREWMAEDKKNMEKAAKRPARDGLTLAAAQNGLPT